MYNQHTGGMATTRHRSLVERGGRKAFVRELAHPNKKPKKMSEQKIDVRKSQEKDSSTYSVQQSY